MITGGLLVVTFFSQDGLDLGETAQLGLTLFFWVASLSLFDDLAAPV